MKHNGFINRKKNNENNTEGKGLKTEEGNLRQST